MSKENYFREMLTDNINEANVMVTGFAYDRGCSVGEGTKLAPQTILSLSSHLPSTTKDGEVLDKIKIYNNGILNDCKNYLDKAYIKAREAYSSDVFNIFLGGDHSIAISSEHAFYDYAKLKGKRPVIIHLDAHPDYCDFYDGSYNSHACPNARAIDCGFRYSDIALVGIRGFEEQEVKLFTQHKEIPLFRASYLKQNGLKEMFDFFKKNYSDALVHISFDIDITDPAYAPGTGTPEAFGLTNDMVLEILLFIVANLNCVSMDIVEVSPALDINDITSWLALKNLYEILNVLNRRIK